MLGKLAAAGFEKLGVPGLIMISSSLLASMSNVSFRCSHGACPGFGVWGFGVVNVFVGSLTRNVVSPDFKTLKLTYSLH